MSEHLKSHSFEAQNESPESSLDAYTFDRLSSVSAQEHAAIKQQSETSHSERIQTKSTHIEIATSDVYDLFDAEEAPESNTEQQERTVFVKGEPVRVVDTYRDKSSNNDGQGNEWVVYKNENGQEVHSMHFSSEAPKSAPVVEINEADGDILDVIDASTARHAAKRVATHESRNYPPASADLVHVMERGGIEFSYEAISPDSEVASGFEGIYMLAHETEPTEPTVRLYRGVNALNASVFGQSSYAEKGLSSIYMNNDDRQKVIGDIQRFTENPTYENLAQYTQSINKHASRAGDKNNIEGRMRAIEDDILQGRSLESALKFEHVKSAAGSDALDISPYLASADRPEVAAAFGQAMLVIDVPESMIAGYGEDGEVLIAGKLSAEHVTAIAIKTQSGENMHNEYSKLYAGTVSELIPKGNSQEYKVAKSRIDQRTANREAVSIAKDRAAVEQKRLESLRSMTGGGITKEAGLVWDETLTYAEQKKYLFNFFNSHLEAPVEGKAYKLSDNRSYTDYLAVGGEIRGDGVIGQNQYGVYSSDTVTDSMIREMSDRFIEEDERRYYREQKRKKRLAAQQ